MKSQIKHFIWGIILLLQFSLAYADAPPNKPLKALSKKEIRIQKRLERREARKIKRQKRKIKRAKRFLNSRLGKWLMKKAIKKTEKRARSKSDERHKLWKLSLIFLLLGVVLFGVAMLILVSAPAGLAGLASLLPAGLVALASGLSLLGSLVTFIIGLFL